MNSGRLVTILWGISGGFFVGLAIIAVFVPLMPAAPFLLLASVCYARISRKLPHWVLDNRFLNNKRFGIHIKNYLEGRGIPLRIKILFVLSWIILGGCSAIFIFPTFVGRMVVLIVALAIGIHTFVFIPTLKK